MNISKTIALLLLFGALSGCATAYQYQSGVGDYYYGQPYGQASVDYYGAPDYGYDTVLYGDPYGWSGRIALGYGYPSYGYPYRNYRYRYGGYPYGPHGPYSGWRGHPPYRPGPPHDRPPLPRAHSGTAPLGAYDPSRPSPARNAEPTAPALPRVKPPAPSTRPQIDRPTRASRGQGRERLP